MKGSKIMKLNAPKTTTWILAVIIGGAGILSHIGVLRIPVISPLAFWLVAGALILLVLAAFMKGL